MVTLAFTLAVGVCAVAFAALPESVEDFGLLPGVMFERILMLVLPVIPFLAFGVLAPRIYRSGAVGSVFLVSLGANGLLHFFGCGPLWQRHTTPGLVFDSVPLDILYHVILIGAASGTLALKKRLRE